MKVFGIGFHKTGTATLGLALKELGFNVCGIRRDLVDKLIEKDYQSVFEIVDQFNAFRDNPWPLLYKELDEQYPNSKFILTYRQEKKWIKSVVNHFGIKETIMRRWIYGIGYPKGNESVYLNRYNSHNQNVLEYFEGRGKDFLQLSWEKGDGWEKLCDFLKKPVPDKPFPHANKRYYTYKSNISNWIKRKIN